MEIAHLLLLPEGEETDTRHLDDLEPDTGNITLGFTATTETRDEDLVVLIDKVQTTVILKQLYLILFGTMMEKRLTGTKAVTFLLFLIS